ncbi:hypothetical protein HIM_05368 [Hirsutella minnesotensis 3608]|uniref:WW domain-containing protein n=1 Tax=Hirsutella minnesotensis 3608 TaxID=1043627 RepID=A0A0F8A5E2_9HYPO|nr:hypothetical protein HIM_05368 [Hirsutella minnesotensis 3608]
MELYQYKNLGDASNELRLAHILPGDAADQIRIRISHSPFPRMPNMIPTRKEYELDSLRTLISRPWVIDEIENGPPVVFNVVTGEVHSLPLYGTSDSTVIHVEPQYEALSYTWGEEDTTDVVHVLEDEAGSAVDVALRKLPVRRNLAAALRSLRDKKNVRVFWIDAICINQDDISERNAQVARMTDIYRAACRVVAWLGVEGNDSTNAFETLGHISAQLEVTKGGRIIASPSAVDPTIWRNDTPVQLPDRTWQALFSLVDRPWFYRLWCWQEIKLGSQRAFLQCGKDEIMWPSFWKAILCLHNKDEIPSNDFREKCRHIVYLQHDSTLSPLSIVLDLSRSKGCADPRDKIYGLLGLTPTRFADGIVVDYGLPVETIFKQAFLAHLESTDRLELLKHCKLSTRRISGPSWVPDWSATDFAAPVLSEQLSSGLSRAWYTYKAPNILQVTGKTFSALQTVGPAASKVTRDTLRVVAKWSSCLPRQKNYPTGETIEEAFALTLCMNRTRERHPYNHFLSTLEWVETIKRVIAADGAAEDDFLHYSREIGNLIQKVRDRRLIITDNGYIGTAPSGAEPGDVIAILLGTYAPIVLRPVNANRYLVVGECYVHGLADSVGYIGPLPRGWQVIIRGDAVGRQMQRFLNISTGEETLDDPRLPKLLSAWERTAYKRGDGDPAIFDRFCNRLTGEVINYDPRLSPDGLRSLGSKLASFDLV